MSALEKTKDLLHEPPEKKEEPPEDIFKIWQESCRIRERHWKNTGRKGCGKDMKRPHCRSGRPLNG